MQHYEKVYVPKHKEEEHTEIKQSAKLEGRFEGEEEHLGSQPSTLQSINDEHEHETPKSTENLQKGFESLKGDLKQKAGELKGKFIEEFGDQPEPEKDLSQESKQHVKEINDEVRGHPHGQEEVVEGQGHARSGPQGADFSKKTGELKEKFESQVEGLKQKAGEFKGKLTEKLGDQPQPEKDLSQESKQHVKEINEEVRGHPHGEEQVVEGQGQARLKQESGFSQRPVEGGKQESNLEDLRFASKDIIDKALGKIGELKDKVVHEGQEVKQGAQQASSQFSQKIEQKGSEFSSQFQGQKHTDVKVQEGNQPLTKDSKGEILDLAQQITDKVQELKAGGQPSTEQRTQFQSQQFSGQQQFSSQQHQEHPHLDTHARSFKPTQETHDLVEAVKEGFEEHVPIAEKVEEFEHQHHGGQPVVESLKQGAQELSGKISQKVEDVKSKFAPSEGQPRSEFRQEGFQSQERGQPAFDKVKQGVQEASSKLSEKAEDVKSRLPPTEGQQRSEFRQESFGTQQRPQGQEFQSQEKGQPAFDKLKQGVQEASSKLSEKAEDVKSRLAPAEGQQKSEFKQESSETRERPQGQESFESRPQESKESFQSGQPVVEQIKQGAQEASGKISETVKEVKDTVNQKAEELQQERQPLVDKITGRIHAVTDNFNQRVAEVKDAFKVEERTDDRKPLLDTVTEGIHGVTSKITHSVEAVKSRIAPVKQEGAIEERPVVEQPAEVPHEGGQSLREKITGGIHNLTEKLSHNVEHFKDRFRGGKEEVHQEATEKVGEIQPQDVKERAKEQLQSGKEEITGRIQESEKQAAEAKQSLKQRANEGIQNVSGQISGKVDELKGKFAAGSEKLGQEGQLWKERLEEDISKKPSEGQEKAGERFAGGEEKVEGSEWGKGLPAREEIAEKVKERKEHEAEVKPSLKERATEGYQNISGQISQKVEGLKSSFEYGSAKLSEQSQLLKEKVETTFGKKDAGFHKVTEGTTETIGELREEQRTEPLVSGNPFEPLGAKDVNFAQPLEPSDIVGGHLKDLTAGVTADNLELKEEFVKQAELPLGQKIREGFSNTSSNIGEKFTAAKEKVLSTFSSKEKSEEKD